MRYTHDAWVPPNASWSRSHGQVTRIEEIYQVNEYAEASRNSGVVGYRVHYEFRTSRGVFEYSQAVSADIDRDRYAPGTEFEVYYQRGQPQWHEIQDFIHDPDGAMNTLFDPALEHTPE
jgi:hypothetical protein